MWSNHTLTQVFFRLSEDFSRHGMLERLARAIHFKLISGLNTGGLSPNPDKPSPNRL